MTNPRDPHRADDEAEKLRLYREGCAEYARTNPEARAWAVTQCDLCDDDGYLTTGRVCDHRDRTESAARRHALVQAELDKIRQRKLDRAQGGAA